MKKVASLVHHGINFVYTYKVHSYKVVCVAFVIVRDMGIAQIAQVF